MQSDVIRWDEIGERDVIAGFHGKFAHSSLMTFVLWRIDSGATLPVHSHPHEQVLHVLEGRFEVTVGGKTSVLEAGTMGIVLPHVVHSGRALTNCRVMDAFAPVREDYKGDGSSGGILQTAARST
jgi:quercetin dioxygenase-like cupin family protein